MTRLGGKEGGEGERCDGKRRRRWEISQHFNEEFSNVSHLVAEFRSLPEMSTEERGAGFEAARVIMQDTHTGTYVLVDLGFSFFC